MRIATVSSAVRRVGDTFCAINWKRNMSRSACYRRAGFQGAAGWPCRECCGKAVLLNLRLTRFADLMFHWQITIL
ncbi:hypothetical protein PUN4_330151 [Paraburkholderia unamae]|nr:hypothetical protein PUN4_330151 [Paraburkholderia unamae]